MMSGISAVPAQTKAAEETISPVRPIPVGLAPGMEVKLVSEKAGEQVYAVLFSRGDAEPLKMKLDEASGMRVIDPKQQRNFQTIQLVSYSQPL